MNGDDNDHSIEDIFPSPRECLGLLPLYAAAVALILVPLWLEDQARPRSTAVYQVAEPDRLAAGR